MKICVLVKQVPDKNDEIVHVILSNLETDGANRIQNKKKLEDILCSLPNLPLRDVPIGIDDSSNKEVEKVINIISQIRSFKNELNVSPGSFIDISLSKINKKKKIFFKNNEITLKKLSRINNFLEKDLNKSSATIVIGGDLFKLYFEENVDLNLIKENLINKQRKYEDAMDKINSRLKNKDFVNRAPKHIVDQEKTNYNNLKKDIKKISFTVKSL